jgi:DNA polymerase-3 subunit delta
MDGRKKLTTLFKEKGTIFHSAPVRDYQMPDWIEGYVRSKGVAIDRRSAILLEEYIGTDLSRAASSIDMLVDNIGAATAINADLIQKFIGISKDYNTFELNNALLKKDRTRAFKVVHYFAANPKSAPFVLVMGGLYSMFSKLHLLRSLKSQNDGDVAKALGVNPYFVKDYKGALRLYSPSKVREVVGLLHRYDVRSKGVDDAGTPEGELLRELVWQILN